MGTRITLRDVAARAHASVTTVSHVLNDVPGKRIAEDTRRRIRRVADELGYRPNLIAQGLRAQRSFTLGFASDNVATTPFAGRMILGAQEAAAEAGYLLLLVSSGGDSDLEDRELRALLDRQVDGILYASMYHRILQPPALLTRTATVLLDARTPCGTFSSVVPDEVGGAREAVEELIRAGHRRIGFINNTDDIPATHARLQGYQEALAANGIDFDPTLVVAHRPESDGYPSARRLLERPDRPTGLFCFADRLALAAYLAAHSLGMSIPQDISIVSFDDQEIISANLHPGLTTMALPHYEMGRWAVDALLGAIADPKAPKVQQQLPCPLVRRGSVAPPV